MDARQIRDLVSTLRQLFDNAPGLVVLMSGPHHAIEYASPNFESSLDKGALVGRRVRDAMPELTEQGFPAMLDRIYETGQFVRGERVLTRIDRHHGVRDELYFDFVYQPVCDEDGLVIGIFGQGTDVTARVRAEQALEESRSTLELATRASGLGIWDWRLDDDRILLSERASQVWGLPRGEVTRDMLRRAIHPADFDTVRRQFRRALDPEIRERTSQEYRVMRPDGSFRWVRVHAEALFDDDCEPPVAVRYVGTVEDISERKETELALRRSESRLRLAIDAGRMAVWSLDADDRLEISPEFRRLFGLAPDHVPTLQELQDRYYPGELERVLALGQEAFERGDRYFEFEYRHLWPNDEVRWLLVRAELLVSPAGEPRGSIGVVIDVTERRQSEERLRLLAQEVDHRANNLLAVVQAAVTLTKADTAEAFKAAVMGRIAALGRAHELLASSRWHGADLRQLVEAELLPYTRGDPGRVVVEGEFVGLSPILAQAFAMVLHELATNAAKYGALSRPEGRVSVTWLRDDIEGAASVTWAEHGGPQVAPPTRRGLGARVLQTALSGALGGSTELDWRPDGLVCRIRLPVTV